MTDLPVPLLAPVPCLLQQQDEEILYGRQVPPSFQEALSLPAPWQDRVLPDQRLGHLETWEVARCVLWVELARILVLKRFSQIVDGQFGRRPEPSRHRVGPCGRWFM